MLDELVSEPRDPGAAAATLRNIYRGALRLCKRIRVNDDGDHNNRVL